MADDITLTVRVRDLTRGDFDRLGRRLNSVDGGVRRVGDSAGRTSEEMDRLGQGVRDVEGRMRDMQESGNAARHDMTHMRRQMGLMSRELRRAARSGELTEEQFRDLNDALERARLDFDHLNNDIERHSAVANRAHREEMARQREAEAEARRAARETEMRNRRVAQDNLAAARRQARDEERAQREASAVRMAAIRRRQQEEAAALRREEAERRAAARQSVADAQRAARDEERALREASAVRMAAIRRRHQQEAEERRRALADERADMNRLRGAGGSVDYSVRFRALGDDDINRLNSSLSRLQDGFRDVGTSSSTAQRRVGALNRDLATMTRILGEAGRTGSMTRRDMQALNGGLTLVSQGARQLRRSGDLTRASFRDMRRDVADLNAQFTLLSRSGNSLQRVSAGARVMSMRLREGNQNASGLRQTMGRAGDWGLRGFSAATGALGLLGAALIGLRNKANMARHAKMLLLATLVLIGPAAQALGVLLITALGGAFVALGAFALKGNAEVKSAFKNMKETVSTTVKQAAQPMADDLVKGIEQVGAAAQNMKPQLTLAFAAAGPLIEDLFGGITDLFARALPGFTVALANSGKAMQGFRTAMGLIGDGFGEMFRIITQGNEDELRRVWVVLGNELRNVLVSLGEFISTAVNSETATLMLVAVFRSATGALNIVAGAFDALDAIVGDLFRTVIDGVMNMDGLITKGKGVATAFDSSSMSVEEMRKKLADINQQIADMDTERAKVPGPAKDVLANTDKYNGLLGQRAALEGAIAVATEGANAAAEKEVQTLQQLWQELLKLNGEQSTMIDTQARLEEAFDKGTEGSEKFAGALKRIGGEWDLTNENAREAWNRLKAVGDATNESTKAAIDAKAPWETVSARFQDGRDKLIALARSLNLSEADTKALTDAILKTPNKTAYLRANAEDLKAKLDAAKKRLAKEPRDSRRAAIRAEISQLEAAIREALIKMKTIDGKTAHTTIYTHHVVIPSTGEARKRKPGKSGGHYASGGVVGAASGGPRSRMSLVGEQGPELVDLAPGSRVRTNSDSRRLLSAANSGGNGQPIVIHLSIGEKHLGEIMVDPLRKAVRTRGGNVQAVLGQKGA